MIFRVVQTKEELYSAIFNIIDPNNNIIGNVMLNGSMGSAEAVLDIQYYNNTIHMERVKRKIAVDVGKKYNLPKVSVMPGSFPNRPYIINSNNASGLIFRHQEGFKKEDLVYDFLELNQSIYYIYHIGFGEKGLCCPIYFNNICIAEIHKPIAVYNGLHTYDLCTSDVNCLLPMIVFCCYFHVYCKYKPGEKITKGVQKTIITDKSKTLLEKCTNPYYEQY